MSNLLQDLKAMREKLAAAVKWNFGVVGNDPICNERLEDVRRLEQKLELESPDLHKEYMNKYY